MVWCRGTVKEKIFEPWIDFMRTKGCEILEGRRVTNFFFNEETSRISEVICGGESYNADAVILAVGISRVQELIKNRCYFRNLFVNLQVVIFIKLKWFS